MKRLLATLGLFLLLFTAGVIACSVPVFRYALEHWAADAYQVEISRNGALSVEQTALLKRLSEAVNTNIKVKEVDSSDPTPQLTVRHPVIMPQILPVWKTAFTEASVTQLLESPIRQEIATRLGQGDSAVWLLLESGDVARDNEVAQMLETELTRLAETLELPELDDQDVKNGLVTVPDDGLRLNFTVLRLSREDAAEAMLIQTLLATESDLREVKEPIVFPVFGRGRVLYALVGKGIRADNLGEAARFLIGSCSCQIKEQNPGVDLLLTADWKKLLKTNQLLDEALPSLSDLEARTPILVDIPQRKLADEGTPLSKLLGSTAGIAMGLVLMVLLLKKLRR